MEHFYCPSRMKHKLSISSYTWWTPSNYLWLMSQWWSMRKCQTCLSHFTKLLWFCSLISSSFSGLAQTIYTCWTHHTKTKQTLLTISLRTRAPRAQAQPKVNSMCISPSCRLAALLTRCCAPQCCASAISSSDNWSWHVGILHLQQP